MTGITGTLHKDQSAFSIIYRSVLLRMGNVSDKSCTDNQKPSFMFKTFLRKSFRLWDNLKKIYCKAGQATDGNMAYARFMLDT